MAFVQVAEEIPDPPPYGQAAAAATTSPAAAAAAEGEAAAAAAGGATAANGYDEVNPQVFALFRQVITRHRPVGRSIVCMV